MTTAHALWRANRYEQARTGLKQAQDALKSLGHIHHTPKSLEVTLGALRVAERIIGANMPEGIDALHARRALFILAQAAEYASTAQFLLSAPEGYDESVLCKAEAKLKNAIHHG